MSYTSFIFAGFVIISLILYYIVPIKYRYLILFFVSAVFYVSNCGISIICPLLVTLIVFCAALLINKQNHIYENTKNELDSIEKKKIRNKIKNKNRTILTITIVISVIMLVMLKYSCVIFSNIFSEKKGINACLAPIGISYYTLMAISYIVDVYWKKIQPETNYIKLSTYLIYFPIIVEGPIEKYDSIADKFNNGAKFEYDNFKDGTFKILFGLFKKLVIADRLAIFVNEVFDNYNAYSNLIILLSIIIYTIQIYADFSGCINIVEGVSQYFGINLTKNFDNPFFSKNIQEFWRRWHISLGIWLKDYIFYPISLLLVNSKLFKKIENSNTKNNVSLIIANFAVWMAMGLWHGISIKYIIYGLYYFVIVVISIVVSSLANSKRVNLNVSNCIKNKLSALRTFVLVNIGMFIFRVKSLIDLRNMIIKVLNLNIISAKQLLLEISNIYINGGFDLFTNKEILIAICSVVILVLIDYLNNKYNDCVHNYLITRSYLSRTIIEIIIVLVIVTFGIYGAYSSTQFIYGEF